MKRWEVQLKRTVTQERNLVIEAPDPASRDALVYGLMRLMDEGKRLPDTVVVVNSLHTDDGWERHNTGEIREP